MDVLITGVQNNNCLMEHNHYCQCCAFSPIKETLSIIYPFITLQTPAAAEGARKPFHVPSRGCRMAAPARVQASQSQGKPLAWWGPSSGTTCKELRGKGRIERTLCKGSTRQRSCNVDKNLLKLSKRKKNPEAQNRDGTEWLIEGFCPSAW